MTGRRLPKVLRAGEAEALVAAARPGRDRLLLRCLLLMGLRVSEVCRLRVEDLDLDGGIALVARAKGGKDRYVPIAPALLEELRAWTAGRAAGPVFLSRLGRPLSTRAVEYLVGRTAREAGLARRIHPHMLRHTFATRLVDADVNLVIIKDLLGHASVATTQIYTRVSVGRLRDAVARLTS